MYKTSHKELVNTTDLSEEIFDMINASGASPLEATSALTILLLTFMDSLVGKEKTEENCTRVREAFEDMYNMWERGPEKK